MKSLSPGARDRLHRLVALANRHADSSVRDLAESRLRLDTLSRESAALSAYLRGYAEADGLRGAEAVTLIAHRRQFVARLNDRIVAIAVETDRWQRRVDEQARRCRQQRAEALAVEQLHARYASHAQERTRRNEQRLQDDAGSALWSRRIPRIEQSAGEIE